MKPFRFTFPLRKCAANVTCGMTIVNYIRE